MPRVLFKPFLHTIPLNFWLRLPIFDVYRLKAIQGASKETAPTIFSFLLKLAAYVSWRKCAKWQLKWTFLSYLFKARKLSGYNPLQTVHCFPSLVHNTDQSVKIWWEITSSPWRPLMTWWKWSNQNVWVSLNFLSRYHKGGLKSSFALKMKTIYLIKWPNGQAYQSVLGKGVLAIASSGHINLPFAIMFFWRSVQLGRRRERPEIIQSNHTAR